MLEEGGGGQRNIKWMRVENLVFHSWKDIWVIDAFSEGKCSKRGKPGRNSTVGSPASSGNAAAPSFTNAPPHPPVYNHQPSRVAHRGFHLNLWQPVAMVTTS